MLGIGQNLISQLHQTLIYIVNVTCPTITPSDQNGNRIQEKIHSQSNTLYAAHMLNPNELCQIRPRKQIMVNISDMYIAHI